VSETGSLPETASGHLVEGLFGVVASMRAELAAARADAPEIEWYRYDILGNVGHLDALLQGDHRDLGRLAGGLPVADIGAADGDLAFALERAFGWEVDIVDNAATNQNGLEGAHQLRRAVGSTAQIVDIDLDRQFHLPRERYGLVFLLGILYHLQNPFYTLHELARHADHLLLSTRVARYAGAESVAISELPVAYLVGPTELNDDPTNYWIFSAAGLVRLVERSGWEVVAQYHAGDTARSDPHSPEHDERVFMLLRRASADGG
jgi:hypothetical protein